MIWNLAVVISSSNINSSAFGELYSVPKVTKSLRHSNTIGHKIILTSHNGVRYKGFAGSPMSTLMRGRDELYAWSPMPTLVSGSRLKTHFSYFKFSISTILLNNSCWRWIIPLFLLWFPSRSAWTFQLQQLPMPERRHVHQWAGRLHLCLPAPFHGWHLRCEDGRRKRLSTRYQPHLAMLCSVTYKPSQEIVVRGHLCLLSLFFLFSSLL